MIARILESRIIDIILILLALRFVFPRLFSFAKPNRLKDTQRVIIVKTENDKEEKNKKPREGDGEYIDYEEMK